MVNSILFPSGYFDRREVDEELREEYSAAVSTGLLEALIFDYDKWFSEGVLRLNKIPDRPVGAVYRGWMMKPGQYADFYCRLKENNIELLTSPEEYERFHIFPNIYPAFGSDTAKALFYPDGKPVDITEVKKTFRRFMVKDFVKSVKGTDFPKYFTSDISDDEFTAQMEKFYKYRSGLYTGGICFKEYLDLKKYDGKTNEYRVFIINHQIAAISRNSFQPLYAKEFPAGFIGKYTSLGSPMYTIDCAELEDGSWKIIEAGDGQVSGLSDGQDCHNFFRTLYYLLND